MFYTFHFVFVFVFFYFVSHKTSYAILSTVFDFKSTAKKQYSTMFVCFYFRERTLLFLLIKFLVLFGIENTYLWGCVCVCWSHEPSIIAIFIDPYRKILQKCRKHMVFHVVYFVWKIWQFFGHWKRGEQRDVLGILGKLKGWNIHQRNNSNKTSMTIYVSQWQIFWMLLLLVFLNNNKNNISYVCSINAMRFFMGYQWNWIEGLLKEGLEKYLKTLFWWWPFLVVYNDPFVGL